MGRPPPTAPPQRPPGTASGPVDPSGGTATPHAKPGHTYVYRRRRRGENYTGWWVFFFLADVYARIYHNSHGSKSRTRQTGLHIFTSLPPPPPGHVSVTFLGAGFCLNRKGKPTCPDRSRLKCTTRLKYRTVTLTDISSGARLSRNQNASNTPPFSMYKSRPA